MQIQNLAPLLDSSLVLFAPPPLESPALLSVVTSSQQCDFEDRSRGRISRNQSALWELEIDLSRIPSLRWTLSPI